MKPIFILMLAVSSVGQLYGQTIDSLYRIVSLQQHDTTELNALLNLSNEFLRKDLEKAKVYAHQAVTLAKSVKKDNRLANAYGYLVALSQNAGQPDSALYYLGLMESLARSNPSISRIKISYNQAAGLFYKNQGEYTKALPFMLDNLNLLPHENENRAGHLLNLGNTYNSMGDFKNAMTYHLQSLTLFEKLNSKRGQSFCLQSLGNDFFELEQYAAATRYLLQSEKLKTELGDKRGELTSWMTLGSVYQQTNNYELALRYFNKALVRARELKLVTEEAGVLFNLGSLLKTTQKTEEAGKMFSEALLLARQLGDSSFVSRIKTYIVSMQNEIQQEKEAEQTLLDNIAISLEKGALTNTAEGHFELAKWYESRKQFEKAYDNLKKGQQLNDSLIGNDVVLQIKNLEEAYQNDKKEKEIALLKKEQELQSLELQKQQANSTLIVIALISVVVIAFLLINRYRVMNRLKRQAELEGMRQNIARDLHDDIGSALSSINIMSQLAIQQSDNSSHLQKISSYSSRMMESMSDMVWSINPMNDSVEQMLMKMKEFAAEMLEPKNVQYNFECDGISDLKIDVEKRKNLFLIFKEAINNIAKYSEASQAGVRLSQANNILSLLVKDNGKGFDTSLATRGNGLKNMAARAHAMHGNCNQASEPGKGTVIEVNVPLT